MKKLLKITSLAVFLLLFQGCTRLLEIPYVLPVPAEQVVQPRDTPVLSEDVIILRGEQQDALLRVEWNRLVFSSLTLPRARTDQTQAVVRVGHIIVCEPTDKAPMGFLRRVVRVFKEGAEYVTETVNATLEEAFKELDTSVSFQIDPINETLNFTVPLRGRKLGEKTEVNLNMQLNGSLALSLKNTFDIKIRNFKTERFTYRFKPSISAQLAASVEGEISYGDELQIAYFRITRTVYVPLLYGRLFPIVFNMRYGVYATYDLRGNVSLQAKLIDFKREASWGYSLTAAGTLEKDDAPPEVTAPESILNAGVSGKAKLGIENRVEFFLYNYEDIKTSITNGIYAKLSGECPLNRGDGLKMVGELSYETSIALKLLVFGKGFESSLTRMPLSARLDIPAFKGVELCTSEFLVCKLNGQDYEADFSVNFSPFDAQNWIITGTSGGSSTNTQQVLIRLRKTGFSGVGTYVFPGQGYGSYVFAQPTRLFLGEQGKCVITTDTPTIMEGTFEFTAANGTQVIRVTDGRFRVQKEN